MGKARHWRPSKYADPAFLEALTEIAARIAASLAAADRKRLPVRMYLAGGAAIHCYTGARTTEDIDAVFSTRVLLPDDLEVYYVNAQGEPRLLYFDRQYNDTLGLLHEDAQQDSIPLTIPGVDARVLEVRALSPVDLAISKIGRFADLDRGDIATLARHGLITERLVRRRTEGALSHYVGNTERAHTSLELACQLIRANSPTAVASTKPALRRRADRT
ncbi:MAG: DUF6036 family nucleotidyltransferase [Burkholderiales bacterium]